MRKRILILGIDSMDRRILDRYIDELPNIKRMREEGVNVDFSGVFPPDSPTSWASIFTGKNPAKHGVVFFIDPLEKTGKLISEEIPNETIRGRTFWDFAGKGGKKVFISLPLLGYPTWEVNGTMIGRATTERDVQMSPPRESGRSLSGLDGMRGLPGRKPMDFVERGLALMKREKDFALRHLKEDQWDLFFYYSAVLDPMEHNFWNCFDPGDPTYVKGNRFEEIIPNFYREYDKIVGEFLASVGEETAVILLSDHGHMRRPTNTVNVNGALMERGLLRMREPRRTLKGAIYKRKDKIFAMISNRRLGDLAAKLLRLMPSAKSIFTAPDNIDWENTVAHVSDLSGIKAYTYGGVVVRKGSLGQRSYEDVRGEIIAMLEGLTHPDTGKKLIKWAKRREDLYIGEHVDRYPDVVFEFQEDYGAGWSLDKTLISKSAAHNIHPGSHRQDSPVLVLYNCGDVALRSGPANLMDFAPTLLDLMGVDAKEAQFDGKSLLKV
jgi:predicted AlkP superfamily phosphohydrolase/phosphomutase